MKGSIRSASALAEANQTLVDYFTALAYRFSLFNLVIIDLY
ncbi:hypothetical protein [Emticicia sp. C21]|nr:hypothetical protein [Emticicia sp. C21]